MLHYSTKNYSYEEEQSFGLHYEVFGYEVFCQIVCAIVFYLWLKYLAFPAVDSLVDAAGTLKLLFEIVYEENPATQVYSLHSATSSGIHSVNKEGLGVISWPECELSVTWPQVNRKKKNWGM